MEHLIRDILSENLAFENKITEQLLSKFCSNTIIVQNLETIAEAKKKIMKEAIIYSDKEDFRDAHFRLNNGHSKQFYEFKFDLSPFPNIRINSIKNLEDAGLVFENNTIKGTPFESNTYDLEIEFFHTHDFDKFETKKVQLFVNADPKDLWKNIPSPKDALFYKTEESSFKSDFLDKKIVIASKRGRSHAHEGTFRDDDFAINQLPFSWNIVSMSDGAGSAKFARLGSQLATQTINDFFKKEDVLNEIEINIQNIFNSNSLDKTNDITGKQNIIRILYEGVLNVYNTLKTTAEEQSFSIKDLHNTLIFTLTKKFGFGYVILSFGVGDCPINLIDKDFSKVELLNTMDVGEFGGGTRFITMKEIYNDSISSRFGIHCVDDFSHLILMTDGIYDPKFMTENKLENLDAWNAFFSDLSGKNDDSAMVDFKNDQNIDQQLLQWIDFWSKGNHDDRTLAIIY